jgi:hypothetical protein
MSSDSNALAIPALTPWRRFFLQWTRLFAWVWLAMVVYQTVQFARSSCPAVSGWSSFFRYLLAPVIAALPFLYLRRVRSWYRRHPPIAWFSAAWWRRASRRGLILALIFAVFFAGFEIFRYRIGGNHAAKLAEDFVNSDATVQKLRGRARLHYAGESYYYWTGAWHASYEFSVNGFSSGDFMVVHVDGTGTQWKVCCWESEANSKVSFFTIAGGKSVEVASPAAKLAENFVNTDSTIQTLRPGVQFREDRETYEHNHGNWSVNYEFKSVGGQPQDVISVHLNRADAQWRVDGWMLQTNSKDTFYKVADDKSVLAACE